MKTYEIRTVTYDGEENETIIKAKNIGKAQHKTIEWLNYHQMPRWHFFDSKTECCAILQHSFYVRIKEIENGKEDVAR